MNTLITKTLCFLLTFIVLVLLLVVSFNYLIDTKASFVLKKKPKYIILGNSHPEFAYNDSLISDFTNLGKSGESYFYIYTKFKKIQNQNKDISAVFLEFDYNQIDMSMNDWIWGDKYINYRYYLYAPFMGVEENFMLLTKNFTAYQKSLATSIRKDFQVIANQEFNYSTKIGGFTPLYESKADSLVSVQTAASGSVSDLTKLPHANFLYINKIISLCKTKNIQVFLVRSPLHPKYEGFKNEKQFLQILKNQFPTTVFLDFSKCPIENLGFKDLEHLNNKGATKYSILFNSLLQEGLLEKNNKQDFIDTKIQLYKSANQIQ